MDYWTGEALTFLLNISAAAECRRRCRVRPGGLECSFHGGLGLALGVAQRSVDGCADGTHLATAGNTLHRSLGPRAPGPPTISLITSNARVDGFRFIAVCACRRIHRRLSTLLWTATRPKGSPRCVLGSRLPCAYMIVHRNDGAALCDAIIMAVDHARFLVPANVGIATTAMQRESVRARLTHGTAITPHREQVSGHAAGSAVVSRTAGGAAPPSG